jgi:hypothetical protein
MNPEKFVITIELVPARKTFGATATTVINSKG